ncbi:flagellar motor switch protein FliM [Nitrosococcus watsonii]|uniref:Flagellar motor switch protein FliM n=1 Tax=Nitrosococcus watsoni (strain C-113) TaxID=105559 RepID=D8K4G7_NITWC|nr:flagellar motor switch protein FliM [Nitrosococcus watsonii]ADJ27864.1 flagellar motor switch protein FliM [Nitrosococcus watsonii C-113]
MAATDILSQDEVDALLSGIAGGGGEDDPRVLGHEKTIRPYDFSSEDRIARAYVPLLEMINERFARQFRLSLFNLLRRATEVTVGGVQVLKFSEYLHTLFMPTSLNLVQIHPLRGAGLFVFDPKLVFMLVDRYFGGSGEFYNRLENREFTPTEMHIIQLVLERTFTDLKQAWEPVLAINFEYLQTEFNPRLATIASPSEIVVVSTFHVEFEGGGGEFHIALPYTLLEPVRELLDTGKKDDFTQADGGWNQALRKNVSDAEVELSCTLTEIRLSLKEVLALKSGDILPIELPSTVTALADGVPVFRVRYGIHNSSRALKVVERLLSPESFTEKLSTEL